MGLSNLFPQTLTINRELSPYVPEWPAMEEVRGPKSPNRFPQPGDSARGAPCVPLAEIPQGGTVWGDNESSSQPRQGCFPNGC